MKKSLSLVLALALLCSLAACTQAPATQSPEDTTPAEISPDSILEETTLFTDSANREVELPANISRVAPSGAFAQMLLLALAPDMMVSNAAKYTQDAEQYLAAEYFSLPVIGQFYGSADLNLEEIAALDAQLIIDCGETKKSSGEDMDAVSESIGVPAIHINATLANMGDAFRILGAVLGREERAEELAAYCERVYTRAVSIADSVGEEKKTAILLVGLEGQGVIANSSVHAEVLDMLTDNIAVVDEPSGRGTGNEVDMEQLYLWNPEVIFFGPDGAFAEAAESDSWQQMDAVKNRSYYEVPYGPYNWLGFPPSSNRYLGLLWIPAVLYPEQVDYDLQAEVTEYYSLFYHCDLTDEQYHELVES